MELSHRSISGGDLGQDAVLPEEAKPEYLRVEADAFILRGGRGHELDAIFNALPHFNGFPRTLSGRLLLTRTLCSVLRGVRADPAHSLLAFRVRFQEVLFNVLLNEDTYNLRCHQSPSQKPAGSANPRLDSFYVDTVGVVSITSLFSAYNKLV